MFFFMLFKDPVLLTTWYVLSLSLDTLRWASENLTHQIKQELHNTAD